MTVRGPIFDGRADAAVRAALEDARRESAQVGATDVRAALRPGHGRRSGRYQRAIRKERRGAAEVVHDGGMVYGPWLEGVGSRNRTTRFKGYHIFRLTAQLLRRKAPRITERVVSRYVGRMQ